MPPRNHSTCPQHTQRQNTPSVPSGSTGGQSAVGTGQRAGSTDSQTTQRDVVNPTNLSLGGFALAGTYAAVSTLSRTPHGADPVQTSLQVVSNTLLAASVAAGAGRAVGNTLNSWASSSTGNASQDEQDSHRTE